MKDECIKWFYRRFTAIIASHISIKRAISSWSYYRLSVCAEFFRAAWKIRYLLGLRSLILLMTCTNSYLPMSNGQIPKWLRRFVFVIVTCTCTNAHEIMQHRPASVVLFGEADNDIISFTIIRTSLQQTNIGATTPVFRRWSSNNVNATCIDI